VSEMPYKKADARFSLQFNRTDPAHLQVIGILNRIGRRGKAQYIVDAVLYSMKVTAGYPLQNAWRPLMKN